MNVILLSKRKFRENANIINIFTKKKVKLMELFMEVTSRKIRNYLQISNKLFVLIIQKVKIKLVILKLN